MEWCIAEFRTHRIDKWSPFQSVADGTPCIVSYNIHYWSLKVFVPFRENDGPEDAMELALNEDDLCQSNLGVYWKL